MPKCNSCGDEKSMFVVRDGICNSCRDNGVAEILLTPIINSQSKKSKSAKNIVIVLSSGKNIVVSEIKLFDSRIIQLLAEFQAKANGKLEGFSSGLGFVGNLSSVLVNSFLLGTIEGSISKSMEKEGNEIIGKLDIIREKILHSGQFVSVSEIINSIYPIPNNWYANLHNHNSEKKIFVSIYEPFLEVKTKDDLNIFLRWSDVEQYIPINQ